MGPPDLLRRAARHGRYDDVRYYAVDHSPALLWDSATWEQSDPSLHYLPIIADPQSWDTDETVHRALEIREGVVQNPSILAYQGRSAEYPHATMK